MNYHIIDFILIVIYIYNINAFHIKSYPHYKQFQIIMREGSTASTYFKINDYVKIVKDVYHYPLNHPKFNSKNLIGIICDIWVCSLPQ